MRYPLPKNLSDLNHGRSSQIILEDTQSQKLNDDTFNYDSQQTEAALASIQSFRTFIDGNLQYMAQIQETQRKRQMVVDLNTIFDGIEALIRIVFILAASGALMVFGFRVFTKLLRIL
jgi:hypothetical protein